MREKFEKEMRKRINNVLDTVHFRKKDLFKYYDEWFMYVNPDWIEIIATKMVVEGVIEFDEEKGYRKF